MRPAVVFDLGNVLIDWEPRRLYRKLFNGDGTAMERFLTEVCSPAWNLEQDAGRSWAEAIELLASRHPDRRDLIAAFRERWDEMLGGPIDGTVQILMELRTAGRPLYALTNWSAETFPLARSRYDFLGWFDGIVVSGEERLVKPDYRIYYRLLERFGLQPQETVFVDDSPVNVAAARHIGMTAIHFTEPAQLRRELLELHLLPRQARASGSQISDAG